LNEGDDLVEVVHVDEPNLLEETFPYTAVPRILFDGPVLEEIDGEVVRFDPQAVKSRDIHITDTTFRDGQQARPPYSVDQIVEIYKMLHRLGGPNGIIRQCEYFLYTDRDREAVDKCRELGYDYPEITGWIRAKARDFRYVKDMGLAESGMLTSSSDYHIFNKQKQTRQQAMDEYLAVVDSALEIGVRPRCHLEDVTRADIAGFVIPFVKALTDRADQAPDHLKPKVRLCDTMGFGIGYPGVELPRSIPKLIWTMIHECGMPSERLEWHGHNDFHKVLINGATAWLYGCDALNGTLLGFGERTGNPPLEGAVIEYAALKGDLNGMDLGVITEMAEYFEKEVGFAISPTMPFVGSNFNVTRAGIHAEGLAADERIYNCFDTTALLNRRPRVSVTDKSGADGVAVWVNDFLGLEGADRLKATKTVRIARWVMDQYANGRITAVSDEELVDQVRKHLADLYAKCKGEV
jgi:citrate (Re)-synthase